MPGAGKSTVGVVLAKTLGMQFADSDLLICEKTGERLQETIDKKGIEAFLKAEEEVCQKLSFENCVIATGGSVVLSDKAMKSLQKNATVVFIDVPIDEIKRRVSNITTRGIACKKGETLNSIYKTRLPFYKKYADIIVSVSSETLEQTVEKIINKL